MYLDAMCTDLQANIEAVAGPALTVVVLMFLSFCIQVAHKHEGVSLAFPYRTAEKTRAVNLVALFSG